MTSNVRIKQSVECNLSCWTSVFFPERGFLLYWQIDCWIIFLSYYANLPYLIKTRRERMIFFNVLWYFLFVRISLGDIELFINLEHIFHLFYEIKSIEKFFLSFWWWKTERGKAHIQWRKWSCRFKICQFMIYCL